MTAGAHCATFVLANVRVGGDRTVDIVMGDGCIEAIAPDLAALSPAATRIEGDGLLALPGLVDGHMHLDKTLTGQAWLPHRAEPERAGIRHHGKPDHAKPDHRHIFARRGAASSQCDVTDFEKV